MGMDFSEFEGQLENQEREAEELKQQEKDIENRERLLDNAISQLREDTRVCEFLQGNYEMTDRAREEISAKQEESKERLLQIEAQLQELAAETNESQTVLEELKQMGEDVSESEAIIADRKRWLSACQSKVQMVAEILSLDIGKLNFEENHEGNKSITKKDGAEENSANGYEKLKNEDSYAMEKLSAYMYEHNYGLYDYPEYSKDPKWQKLHEAVFPEYHIEKTADSRLEKIREDLEHVGIRSEEFTGYVVSEASPGKWFVASGEKHLEFLDYWNNMSDYYVEKCDEIQMVDSRLIEGVEVSNYDIEKPERFWGQHVSGGTKESFVEIASNISEVQTRLDAEVPLNDLLSDAKLGKCASIYFDKSSGSYSREATVLEGDGFYVLSGNGRHRVLAAQELDCRIPIRVVGKLVKYD